MAPRFLRPVDPAGPVTLAWITSGLVLTGALKRQGHRQMCDVLRTPHGLTLVAVFLLHLAKRLGPLDPFCALGRLITPKET